MKKIRADSRIFFGIFLGIEEVVEAEVEADPTNALKEGDAIVDASARPNIPEQDET